MRKYISALSQDSKIHFFMKFYLKLSSNENSVKFFMKTAKDKNTSVQIALY